MSNNLSNRATETDSKGVKHQVHYGTLTYPDGQVLGARCDLEEAPPPLPNRYRFWSY